MFFAMDKPMFDDMSNGELLLADALAHLLDCYQEYYIDKDGNVCHKEQVDGDMTILIRTNNLPWVWLPKRMRRMNN